MAQNRSRSKHNRRLTAGVLATLVIATAFAVSDNDGHRQPDGQSGGGGAAGAPHGHRSSGGGAGGDAGGGGETAPVTQQYETAGAASQDGASIGAHGPYGPGEGIDGQDDGLIPNGENGLMRLADYVVRQTDPGNGSNPGNVNQGGVPGGLPGGPISGDGSHGGPGSGSGGPDGSGPITPGGGGPGDVGGSGGGGGGGGGGSGPGGGGFIGGGSGGSGGGGGGSPGPSGPGNPTGGPSNSGPNAGGNSGGAGGQGGNSGSGGSGGSNGGNGGGGDNGSGGNGGSGGGGGGGNGCAQTDSCWTPPGGDPSPPQGLPPGFGDNPTNDVPGPVPEPAMWLMMILGLGGVGSMLRVQRRKDRQALA